jgi:hypothetical protein
MATIEVTPGRYFAGVWFVGGGLDIASASTTELDWMGALFRDSAPDDSGQCEWAFRYRFRYYHPDSTSPHDGLDEKSGYEARMFTSERKAMEMVEKVAGVVASRLNMPLDFIPVFSSEPSAMMDRLRDKPWAHIQVQEKPKRK